MTIISSVLLAVLASCLLSSCATDQPQQEVMTGVIQAPTQKVPEWIPCIKDGEIPDIPTTVRDPKASLDDQIEQWNIDNDHWKKYAKNSDALMQACHSAKAPPTGAPK